MGVGRLDEARVRLRERSSSRLFGLSRDGWGAMRDDSAAVTLTLEQFQADGVNVPDTYLLRVSEPTSSWDGAYLSFTGVSHFRTGGWCAAYKHLCDASPYKVVVDSSCPAGTCKLLCAWPGLSPVTQRYCTGYFLAQQAYGNQWFVGHAPDCDAAFFELAPQ